MARRPTRFAAAALAAMALASVAIGGASARSDLSPVREVTARFHSLTQAGKAGYGAFPAGVPLHECISSLTGAGAMGIHWVNGGLLDGTLDPNKPEVLVYEPGSDGKLHLVALEYVIFQADWYANHAANTMPMLFGQELMVGDAARFQIPPFFALHVWLYKNNPSGMFSSWNPNVSCGSAVASAGVAAAGVSTAAATAAGRLASARDSRWLCTVAATA